MGRLSKVMDAYFGNVAAGYPIMVTSASPVVAKVIPIFSNMRVSSTGFSTEASTILLFFITCVKVITDQSN
jgi:antitoxin (DNA-binding transcriptional repressor) of toxin-antitoxin stability system